MILAVVTITTVSFMDSLSLSEANLLKEIQYHSGDFSPRLVEVSASYFPLNCDK